MKKCNYPYDCYDDIPIKYIYIDGLACIGYKFGDEEIRDGIQVINNIESEWTKNIVNFFNNNLGVDYIRCNNNSLYYTTPDRVKLFNRNKKLEQLGILD